MQNIVVDNIIDNKYYLIGPLIGFGGFLVSVLTVGGVFVRPDEDGNKKFSMKGFVEYLKLPFNWRLRHTAWALFNHIPLMTRLKLLNMNWVFMVSVGGLISTSIYIYNNK